MKNVLKINNIIIKKNNVFYEYDITEEWKKYLTNDKLHIEYDFDVSSIPKSILYIPILCNLLPICWVLNLEIFVDELDEEFYNSIEDVKNGYQKMYPNIKMQGNLKVEKIIPNIHEKSNNGALFSGGVDSFDTLFRHIDEKPILLTICGADVLLSDENGWNNVKMQNYEVAKRYGLDFRTIKSNFKLILNYTELSKFVNKYVNDEWWHGFQHGIGILGHMAPISFKYNIGKLYIASSYSENEIGKYTCASDPLIDNCLRFASTEIYHDGYEFNRQDKIHNICEYSNKNNNDKIQVRVCWESKGGNNCCVCEKCCRTILGFIAEKADPRNFGFKLDGDIYKKFIKSVNKYGKYKPGFYTCIQNRYRENYDISDTPRELIKFRESKIKTNKPLYIKFIEKIKKRIYIIRNKLLKR